MLEAKRADLVEIPETRGGSPDQVILVCFPRDLTARGDVRLRLRLCLGAGTGTVGMLLAKFPALFPFSLVVAYFAETDSQQSKGRAKARGRSTRHGRGRERGRGHGKHARPVAVERQRQRPLRRWSKAFTARGYAVLIIISISISPFLSLHSPLHILHIPSQPSTRSSLRCLYPSTTNTQHRSCRVVSCRAINSEPARASPPFVYIIHARRV